jgi:hypothetical protein
MLVLPALNGCLWHTRKVPQAIVPANVLSSPPEKLVDAINKQYDAINSLNATVTFTATQGGSLKGSETTYTSFNGYILLRKPESLRVIGFLPVVHTRAFDMASDGKTFQLWIPPKNKVIEGTNAEPKPPSQNAFENMRPYIFVDSLLIRKIGPEDELLPSADSKTEINPKTRKLELIPEYVLTVAVRQGNSNILHPARDLLQPYRPAADRRRYLRPEWADPDPGDVWADADVRGGAFSWDNHDQAAARSVSDSDQLPEAGGEPAAERRAVPAYDSGRHAGAEAAVRQRTASERRSARSC